MSVGYGAARPLPVFNDGKNHKENRRVEMHMRASAEAPPVGKVKVKGGGATGGAAAAAAKQPRAARAQAWG